MQARQPKHRFTKCRMLHVNPGGDGTATATVGSRRQRRYTQNGLISKADAITNLEQG